MANIIILLAIGVFAGWLSGLVGIGGGIIVVPALMFFLSYSIRDAQGTSISALVPPIGLMAAYYYYKNGNVNIHSAILIALGFFVGALLGAKTNYLIKKDVVEKIFALLLIIIAMNIFINPKH